MHTHLVLILDVLVHLLGPNDQSYISCDPEDEILIKPKESLPRFRLLGGNDWPEMNSKVIEIR